METINIFLGLITALLIIVILLLNNLIKKGKQIMTSLEQLQADLQLIDAETTRIAQLFASQLEQLTNGTITVQQVNDTVLPELEKLKAIGK